MAAERKLTHRGVFEALLAVGEAATFALLDEHPELVVRLPPDIAPAADLDEEAQRLADLLARLHRVVDRYARLAEPNDDVPF